MTGGAGFIGAHVVERLVGAGYRVINLDLLTYAGNLKNLASVTGNVRHVFVQGDICDRRMVATLLAEHRPETVFNIAAESHVDRSIDNAEVFLRTNINGTFCLLDESLNYWSKLPAARKGQFRFIQMSTDEVYGSIAEGAFTEDSNYAPNSPYAASKAAGDQMARAYGVTYGLPVIVVRASNTYGPRQFPEKLIPHTVLSALTGRPLPVYGEGKNVRDWMYVEDLVRGLECVVERGSSGHVYHFAGGEERCNLDTVRMICAELDRLRPNSNRYESGITFVTDRPGHDLRYAMSADKATRIFGWKPTTRFEDGLGATVAWYLANDDWCRAVLARGYDVERIGTRAGS